jgi:translation elongation factor EF-Ts
VIDVTAADVRELREQSGCSMQSARKFLELSGGDVTLAGEISRYWGCAIHVKGMTHEEWVLKQARETVKEK